MAKQYQTLGDVPCDKQMTPIDWLLAFIGYALVISLMLLAEAKGIIGNQDVYNTIGF